MWEKRAVTSRISPLKDEGRICPVQNVFSFRRFITCGRANIREALVLPALAFDLKKLWMKREHGKLRTHASEKCHHLYISFQEVHLHGEMNPS